MKLETENDGFVILCAMRYCLGRSSYAPSLMIEWLRAHWHQIDPRDRSIIMRDVREAVSASEGSCGLLSLPYAREWRDLAWWAEAQDAEEDGYANTR